MERTYWSKQVLRANGLVAVLMLTQSGSALGQTVGGETRERAQKSEEKVNPAEVVALLRQLQYQVRELNAEVGTLKEQQQSAQTESAALRVELDQTKSQLMAVAGGAERVAHEPMNPSATAPLTGAEARIS